MELFINKTGLGKVLACGKSGPLFGDRKNNNQVTNKKQQNIKQQEELKIAFEKELSRNVEFITNHKSSPVYEEITEDGFSIIRFGGRK